MKREEIKSYKDACKVIGRKPRTYKDKHLNLYEQLSTIIAALNFISNNNFSQYKSKKELLFLAKFYQLQAVQFKSTHSYEKSLENSLELDVMPTDVIPF